MRAFIDHKPDAVPATFAVFLHANLPAVRRFAVAYVGPDACDDVVSETFLAAWERFRRQPDTPIDRAWLLGVALNKCRMASRAERSWRRRLDRAVHHASQQVDETEDAAERLDASARRADLLAAFASLSDAERHVLSLSVWGGISPTEIANALEIPAGTVRSHLHRAKKSIELSISPSEVKP